MRRKLLIAAGVVLVAVGLAMVPLPLPATHVVDRAHIERSPGLVYTYVTTPRHWPTWHPSSLGVSGAVDHSLELGERVTEEFVVAGRSGRAEWTVVEREAPRYWRIDGRIGEHHAGEVSYSVVPEGTGAGFTREFVYPTRNLLFAVVNAVELRPKIEDESARAVANLKRVLEGGSAVGGQ